MSSRKRKKRPRRGSPDYNAGGEGSAQSHDSHGPPPPSAFFVQAHEATIVRDSADLARALTARDHGGGKAGLIRWQGDGGNSGDEIWVDRYDARLLLTSLPNSSIARRDAPSPSPTGWSDLPSDSEDAFFLSAGELEDVRREKRRKMMDQSRQERLRALESDAEASNAHHPADDRILWGGDDEEILAKPDATQRTLMERTARHLLSSSNPGQLEMRILANHGADGRFAFLRGRWRDAWAAVRRAAQEEKEADVKRKATEKPVGGLVAYGDSDDEEEQEDKVGEGVLLDSKKGVDEAEKEARRARARDWAKKRRETEKLTS